MDHPVLEEFLPRRGLQKPPELQAPQDHGNPCLNVETIVGHVTNFEISSPHVQPWVDVLQWLGRHGRNAKAEQRIIIVLCLSNHMPFHHFPLCDLGTSGVTILQLGGP